MVPESPRPQPQLGRVFVSSVFGGMGDIRRRVEEAARGTGFHPVMTEDLVAQPGDVASVIDREIRNCATYVGLFSKRRGTVPGGERWAITEQEFRLAGRYGLRRLVFLDRSAEAERDEALRRFLEKRLKAHAGDVAGARRFQEERLGVNRRIGDVEGIAAALYDLAFLDLEGRNVSDAGAKLAEAWPLLLRLNRVDGVAAVGDLYGQMLAATRDPEAIGVLEQTRRAWTILGNAERAREIAGLIESLNRSSP